MAEIMITKENFEEEVLKSNIPVLVDFFATWCGPCKMLSPIISEIANEYEGKVKVCKVNVDEQAEIALNYNISSIPTILIFRDGEVSNTTIGFSTKQEIVALL